MTEHANRIQALQEHFPDLPRSVVIKAEILRAGLRFTPDLIDAGRWAVPQTHFLFEYDHDDTRDLRKFAEQWEVTPAYFLLEDGTSILVILDHESQYSIRALGDGAFGLFSGDQRIAGVRFDPRPRWLTERTEDGTPMFSIAAGCGGRCIFSFSNLSYCEYFKSGDQCRFCCLVPASGRRQAMGIDRLTRMDVSKLVETFRVAVEEGCVAHVVMTGGGLLDRRMEADFYVQVVAALKGSCSEAKDLPFLIALQAMEREDWRRLRDVGVDSVCSPIEVWDGRMMQAIAPGKAKSVGRERWMESLCAATEIFEPGYVHNAVVAGVELAAPSVFSSVQEGIESNVDYFRWNLAHGILPKFSVWTNVPGSLYQEQEPPPTEYYLTLVRERDRLMQRYEMNFPPVECQKCFCIGFDYDLPTAAPKGDSHVGH